MKKIVVCVSLLCASFLSACAFDVIRVKQLPVNLESENSCNHSFVLSQNAQVTPAGNYKRTLKNGTRWNCVGRIEQGNVYATKDQILTVEASNIFEAYIVVSSTKLLGFYLPVERTFSPIESPIKLVTNEIAQ